MMAGLIYVEGHDDHHRPTPAQRCVAVPVAQRLDRQPDRPAGYCVAAHLRSTRPIWHRAGNHDHLAAQTTASPGTADRTRNTSKTPPHIERGIPNNTCANSSLCGPNCVANRRQRLKSGRIGKRDIRRIADSIGIDSENDAESIPRMQAMLHALNLIETSQTAISAIDNDAVKLFWDASPRIQLVNILRSYPNINFEVPMDLKALSQVTYYSNFPARLSVDIRTQMSRICSRKSRQHTGSHIRSFFAFLCGGRHGSMAFSDHTLKTLYRNIRWYASGQRTRPRQRAFNGWTGRSSSPCSKSCRVWVIVDLGYAASRRRTPVGIAAYSAGPRAFYQPARPAIGRRKARSSCNRISKSSRWGRFRCTIWPTWNALPTAKNSTKALSPTASPATAPTRLSSAVNRPNRLWSFWKKPLHSRCRKTSRARWRNGAGSTNASSSAATSPSCKWTRPTYWTNCSPTRLCASTCTGWTTTQRGCTPKPRHEIEAQLRKLEMLPTYSQGPEPTFRTACAGTASICARDIPCPASTSPAPFAASPNPPTITTPDAPERARRRHHRHGHPSHHRVAGTDDGRSTAAGVAQAAQGVGQPLRRWASRQSHAAAHGKRRRPARASRVSTAAWAAMIRPLPQSQGIGIVDEATGTRFNRCSPNGASLSTRTSGGRGT